MERVDESVREVEWGRHVVRDTRNGVELSGSFLGFPDTKKTNKEVVGKTIVQHLGDKEDVGAQGRL